MVNSNRPKRVRKLANTPLKPPKKPDGFPLSPHPSGKWQKRIKGHLYYFGSWARRENGKLVRVDGDGAAEAKAEYLAKRDEILTGRTPKASADEMSVKDICNKFLTYKYKLLQSRKITARTFAEYQATANRISKCFGPHRLVDDLRDEDFESLQADLAAQFGVVREGNEVVRIKSVFKHGRKSDVVPGTFKQPSASMLRKNRNAGGKKLFSAEEIHTLLNGRTDKPKRGKPKKLAGAGVQLRAMILLGLNCGFGNSDCSDLPINSVDLKAGWIDFPRPKTGIERRCPLWPETRAAIEAALAERTEPTSKVDRECLFITQQGRRWVRTHITETKMDDGTMVPGVAGNINAVGGEFTKLLKRFGINGRRGLGFYALRHTFRTRADAAKDQPAIRYIMGHVDASIDGRYRETIDDDRLVAVTNCVRSWLFGKGGAK